MAKLTWLGEDEENVPGPSFTIAFGNLKFAKGEPVEVSDKNIIAKAKTNKFFKVSDALSLPKKAENV